MPRLDTLDVQSYFITFGRESGTCDEAHALAAAPSVGISVHP